MESKMILPSEEPRIDSEARSGWGMRPTMLRSRLQIPAMLSRDPLGLADLVVLPCGLQ